MLVYQRVRCFLMLFGEFGHFDLKRSAKGWIVFSRVEWQWFTWHSHKPPFPRVPLGIDTTLQYWLKTHQIPLVAVSMPHSFGSKYLVCCWLNHNMFVAHLAISADLLLFQVLPMFAA